MSDPSADLRIPASRGLPDGLVVPAGELTERFSRSSGPGGQSVNTTDSRVTLSWDIARSQALSETHRAALLQRLANRLTDGVISINAAEHRTQFGNRVAARGRLAVLVGAALMPTATRRATRPSRAARQARLDVKRRRSELKASRAHIRPD